MRWKQAGLIPVPFEKAVLFQIVFRMFFSYNIAVRTTQNKGGSNMYSIEALATLSGLTTRTLRNYLKSGVLEGSKDSGLWQFTEAQVEAFLHNPAVRPSITAKRNALVYDFLAGQTKGKNEACILLDRTMSQAAAKELAYFFCSALSSLTEIQFSYSYEASKAHFILKGREEDISAIMKAYRQRDF